MYIENGDGRIYITGTIFMMVVLIVLIIMWILIWTIPEYGRMIEKVIPNSKALPAVVTVIWAFGTVVLGAISARYIKSGSPENEAEAIQAYISGYIDPERFRNLINKRLMDAVILGVLSPDKWKSIFRKGYKQDLSRFEKYFDFIDYHFGTASTIDWNLLRKQNNIAIRAVRRIFSEFKEQSETIESKKLRNLENPEKSEITPSEMMRGAYANVPWDSILSQA